MNIENEMTSLKWHLEEIKQRYKTLEQEYKKQTEQGFDKWEPAHKEGYYTYYPDCRIVTLTFFNIVKDTEIKNNFMCFRTWQEADTSSKQALAYRMLWELADGGECQIIKSDDEYATKAYCLPNTTGMPTFSTKERAQSAIDKIGTELLDTIFKQEKKIGLK